MIIPGDYHVHTSRCDGDITPAELARSAYGRGFKSLGFSSHSYTPFDGGFGMTEQSEAAYRAEIAALKEEYGGRMNIFLGIEQDVLSSPAAGYDYIIGGVHYIRRGDTAIPVDLSPERAEAGVREHFGGDWLRYVAAYYEMAARIPELTGADIVAHFDLVSKFNEGNRYFDERGRAYRSIACEALRCASASRPVFELNSGGVRRGRRSRIYPDVFLLREIRALGCDIIFSSDAHEKASLGFIFPEMAALARECGFTYAKYLTPEGFADYRIK